MKKMFKNSTILVLMFSLIIFFSLCTHSSNAQTDAQINSVVKILSFNGIYLTPVNYNLEKFNFPYPMVSNPLSHGSGVLINKDGLIATAKHVISTSRFNVVQFPGDEEKIQPSYFAYMDKELDYGFLYLCLNVKHYIEPTKKPLKLDYNTSVTAIGYPIDNTALRPTISKGDITSWSKTEIQFNAPITFGFSGGALINQKDKNLIGIISRGFLMSGGSSEMGRAILIDSVIRITKEKQFNEKLSLICDFTKEQVKNPQNVKILNQFTQMVYYMSIGDKQKLKSLIGEVDINDFRVWPELCASIIAVKLGLDWNTFVTALSEEGVLFDDNFKWIAELKEKIGEEKTKKFIAFYGNMIDYALEAYKSNDAIAYPETIPLDEGYSSYNIIYYLLYQYEKIKKATETNEGDAK